VPAAIHHDVPSALGEQTASLSILAGRDAHFTVKDLRKVTGVRIAHGQADVDDAQVAFREQFARALDAQPDEIKRGCQSRGTFEEPAEMVFAHARNAGERGQVEGRSKVLVHVRRHLAQFEGRQCAGPGSARHIGIAITAHEMDGKRLGNPLHEQRARIARGHSLGFQAIE